MTTGVVGQRVRAARRRRAVRRPAAPPRPEGLVHLELTRAEAEALVLLCASSPGSAGEVEPLLFEKLGNAVRCAWRRG